MGLSVSDKLAFIREYKKQGGKGNYLSAIKQYEDGGEVTNNSNPSNININYKPITGEFFIPPKEKPIYQPVRDNTDIQRENPVERQYKIDKAKQRQNDGEVKQAPDESFVKKIYREVVPEYIQRNLETGAEMTNKFNNKMLQPTMALATIPMGIGITSAAFNSVKAKKMYDIAATAGDIAGMTKWSQLGTNAVNTGINTSGALANLEKSAVNNVSDLLQFDYFNMLQRPLLKTAVKYGLNGNKLSAGYGVAATGNAVRNINQSVNEHKFGGEITQGIPYQATTNQQVWQGTIPQQPIVQSKPLNFNYQSNIQQDITNIPKVIPEVSGKRGYLPGESIKERPNFSSNLITNLAMTDNAKIPHGDWARYYGGYALTGEGEGYGGKKNKYDLRISRYKPSKATNSDAEYISNQEPEFKSQIVKYFSENYEGKPLRTGYGVNPKKRGDLESYSKFGDLGKFKISAGQDSIGDYISYYDKWNYSRNDDPDTDKSEWLGAVKPYEVYDRIYYTKTPEGKIIPKEIPKEDFKQSWNRITKKETK